MKLLDTYSVVETNGPPGDLDKQLTKIGLEFRKLSGLGAGPSEIKEGVVAWVNLHPIESALILNILANRIDKIIEIFFNWMRGKFNKQKEIPVVNFYIYKDTHNCWQMTIPLNKRVSKKTIEGKIKKAREIFEEYKRTNGL